MNFDLPQNVKFVLDTLIKNGHKAYIVGGCVRDLLCRKTPHDYDVTTSALPYQIQSLFEKAVATGLKHGTVTVILNGEPIEITTFRTENQYTDNRHPEKVDFVTDVKHDLARRDFTVNAMCYNNYEGLIDLYGGKDDIKQKTLKAVGNPKTRFCEDALRILRLFRFAATLEFSIDPQTLNAALEYADLLKNISAERVFSEIKKSVSGNNLTVLSSLLSTTALENYCLKNTDLKNITNITNKTDLRLFGFLNLTSTNLAFTLDKLKCDNRFKNYSQKMSFFTKHIITADKPSIKKALNYADKDIVADALEYYKNILNIETDSHFKLLEEIVSNREPYKISQLDISGKDLTDLGFSGKDVGSKLDFLLDAVIQNPQLNSHKKLLNLICN